MLPLPLGYLMCHCFRLLPQFADSHKVHRAGMTFRLGRSCHLLYRCCVQASFVVTNPGSFYLSEPQQEESVQETKNAKRSNNIYGTSQRQPILRCPS